MASASLPIQLAQVPKKILIVRLSAIGDVIMASSVLPALRARWPEAEIHWLTEGIGAELLKDHPHLAKVWVWPRGQWQRWAKARQYGTLLKEVFRWRRELRAEQFDLAIDLQGLIKSAAFTWLTGAKVRVGLRCRENSHLLMTHVVPDDPNKPGPFCREYRAMLAALGLSPADARVDLYPTPVAQEQAGALLAASGNAKAPILLFPFTTRPQKHWFADRWAQLAGVLARDLGHPVWILGGPGDLDQALAIAQASGHPEVRVRAGKESNLQEKMALVARAALAVGVDTGLTHLAVGSNVPTVVLFGSTCGYLDTAPGRGTVLYEHLACSPCRRHPTCNGSFDCLRAFTVDRVATAAKALWAK